MTIWQKIKAIQMKFKELNRQRGFVQFNDYGFARMWDRWPVMKPRCERTVRWQDVARIDAAMWDCFVGHAVGLVFFNEKDEYIAHIYEDLKGYAAFVAYVKERFSGFNCHNFKAIEMMWLTASDVNFPCWNRQKKIGDLVESVQGKSIIWKDTQEVFLEFDHEKQN